MKVIAHKSCLAASCLFLSVAEGQDPGQETKPTQEKKEDLGERLIRKASTDGDEGVMDGLVRLMDESAERLELQFDPGKRTQEVQSRILTELDEAIQMASKKTAPKSRSSKPSRGDRRSSGRSDAPPAKDPSKDEGTPSPRGEPGESARKGSAASVDPEGGALREVRRSWGHLPERERDEVIQGINEAYIERFKIWIEKYYQALQEAKE